jgi:hypothetical protein
MSRKAVLRSGLTRAKNQRLMKNLCACLLLLFSSVVAGAKSRSIVVTWPPNKPAIALTFDKFRQLGSHSGQNSYVSDVTVLNLTDNQIPSESFTVYLFDKNKIRIGQGSLQVTDLDGGQSTKIQFQFNSGGVPTSLKLSAKPQPAIVQPPSAGPPHP